MNQKRIVLACDHGGFKLLKELKIFLQNDNYKVIDRGCNSKASCDYPDIAKDALIEARRKGMHCILICGTGIGMSMVANRITGVRCALCTDATMARLAKEHNSANVLALGERIVGIELAKDIVRTFLNTEFSGEERHSRRINKIE